MTRESPKPARANPFADPPAGGPPQRSVRLASADMSTARPEDLHVPGVDYAIDKTHPLWKPRLAQLATLGTAALTDLLTAFKSSPVVLHPVICRMDGKAVEVGIGARRVLAARAYNAWAAEHGREPMRVPLLIRNWSDAVWQKAIAAENSGRLADDVVAEAEHFAHLVEVCGGEKTAAHAAAMRLEQFRGVTRINSMPDHVKALVREHAVPRDVAVLIAALPTRRQEAELGRLVAARAFTAGLAAAALAEASGKDAGAPKPEKARPEAAPRRPAPPRAVVSAMGDSLMARLSAGERLPLSRDVALTVLALSGADPDAIGKVPGLAEALREAHEAVKASRKSAAEAAHREEE